MFVSLIFVLILCLSLVLAYLCTLKKQKKSVSDIFKKTDPPYILLAVHNNEDCIEGIIQSIINNKNLYNFVLSTNDLLVVDLDSHDNTIPIIEKISKKYPFIKLIN